MRVTVSYVNQSVSVYTKSHIQMKETKGFYRYSFSLFLFLSLSSHSFARFLFHLLSLLFLTCRVYLTFSSERGEFHPFLSSRLVSQVAARQREKEGEKILFCAQRDEHTLRVRLRRVNEIKSPVLTFVMKHICQRLSEWEKKFAKEGEKEKNIMHK